MKPPTRFASLIVLTTAIEVLLMALPPGLAALDARLYYGADEALALLAKLGPRGRTAYFVHECIDVGFIAVYTMLLRELAIRWRLPSGLLGSLVFTPGTADLLETTGILSLLGTHPSEPRWLAIAVSYCTPMKWAAFLAVTVALQVARLDPRRRNIEART